jgi:hypothetical protein
MQIECYKTRDEYRILVEKPAAKSPLGREGERIKLR